MKEVSRVKTKHVCEINEDKFIFFPPLICGSRKRKRKQESQESSIKKEKETRTKIQFVIGLSTPSKMDTCNALNSKHGWFLKLHFFGVAFYTAVNTKR